MTSLLPAARAVLIVLAGLALLPPGAVAQTGGPAAPADLAGAPLQDDLNALARRLADAWSRGNLESLAAVMAPDGLALHLGGEVHPALGIRQTRAALQDFLKETGEGTARPVRSEILGGEQPRGLVELGWTPAPGSLPAPAGYSVFIGLQRRSDGWRATEIRIIR